MLRRRIKRPLINTSVLESVSYRRKPRGNPSESPAPRLSPGWDSKPLHRKLTVNQPGDIYEQEADQIAEQIMCMPESQVQRCTCGGAAGPDGECAACRASHLAMQRKSPTPRMTAGDAPASVHQTLSRSGQPLDRSTRSYMEARFGQDFGNVRVHADSQAAQSAADVNAHAYTVGQDMVFGSRQYAPGTTAGQKLIAHELVHVVQQGSSQEGVRVAPFQVQRVELTYDDGPDEAGYTRKILEVLKKSNAKATFYVVGRRVVQGDNWRVVFDIAASGNWLGNHAFDWNMKRDNHIFLHGKKEERARKILLTEWAIRDALIKGKADAQKKKTWDAIPRANRTYIEDVIAHGTGRFRTPGFKSKWWREDERITIGAIADVNEILAAAGLRIFSVSDEVDIDPTDWKAGKTAQKISQDVKSDLDDDDSILLHSRIAASAQATPAIIAEIKKHGWSFTAPSRGKIGQLMPQAGFAGLSSISNPPTHAQIMQARKFLFGNPQYGAFLLGFVAIGIFKMAQAAGEREVRDFISALETTVVKFDKCKYYAAGCLAINSNFALLYRFLKVWLDKTPFPRDASKY